ncbi:hypothetical protein DL768_006144 [Monosporascus sp. mg162]|nr:hypothetical protein DL768_006144 [Monosporascus sp. mg162]
MPRLDDGAALLVPPVAGRAVGAGTALIRDWGGDELAAHRRCGVLHVRLAEERGISVVPGGGDGQEDLRGEVCQHRAGRGSNATNALPALGEFTDESGF